MKHRFISAFLILVVVFSLSTVVATYDDDDDDDDSTASGFWTVPVVVSGGGCFCWPILIFVGLFGFLALYAEYDGEDPIGGYFGDVKKGIVWAVISALFLVLYLLCLVIQGCL